MNEITARQDAQRRTAVIGGCLSGLMTIAHGAAALSFYFGERDVVGAGMQALGTVIWAAYAAWQVR